MRLVAAVAAVILSLAGLVVAHGPAGTTAAETRSVSGIVFFDRNLNGMRDVGEFGAPDRTVEVQDSVENTVYRGESSAGGRYEITGLSSDRGYLVYLATDEETPCGDTNMRPLEPDTDWSHVDLAAIQGDGEISGAVVDDANENGLRDPGEPGWEGWNVLLQGAPTEGMGGCGANVTSDARGQFRFRGLPQGSYWLLADPPEESASMLWEFTYPTTGDTVYPRLRVPAENVELPEGVLSVHKEFGVHALYGSGTIDVATFIDENTNDVRDTGEPLVPCWQSRDFTVFRSVPGVGLVPVMIGSVPCVEDISSMSALPDGAYGLFFPWWCSDPQQPGPPGNPYEPVIAMVELTGGGRVLVEHGRCPAGWPQSTPAPTATPATATPSAEITVIAPDVGERTAEAGGVMGLRWIVIPACLGAIAGAVLFQRLRRRRDA